MTPVERLQMYHSGDKVKIGNAYFAAPEPAPQPEKPDPLHIAQNQIVQAHFGLSNIYEELAENLR